MGCHFLLQCMKVKSEGEVAQSCPTLQDPMDCSLSGSSSIHGIFQARVLEWVAIAFSNVISAASISSEYRFLLHPLWPQGYCHSWDSMTLVTREGVWLKAQLNLQSISVILAVITGKDVRLKRDQWDRFQSELVTNTWNWRSQLFAYLSIGQNQTPPLWWPEPISSLFFLTSLNWVLIYKLGKNAWFSW